MVKGIEAVLGTSMNVLEGFLLRGSGQKK